MSNAHDGIASELAEWIRRQHVFFVATAPLSADGLINCSPKGMDTLRILGPDEVAYLDLTGSGVETIAHSRENGRIVLMFCAFEGAPQVVRLHGTSRVLEAGTLEYAALAGLFPAYPGRRAIIHATIRRVSTSCGYSLPRFEYVGDRDTLVRWSESKGPAGLAKYRREKNAHSVDGLPGLPAEAADPADLR